MRHRGFAAIVMGAVILLAAPSGALAASELPEQPQTVEQGLGRSLDYLDETDRDGCTALDLAGIAAACGTDSVSVLTALPEGDYMYVQPEDGAVLLSADGEVKYLIVEDPDHKVLWAGIYSGKENDPPQTMLRWTLEEKAPEEDAPDAGQTDETGLTLDLTAVAAASSEPIYVQIATDEDIYSISKFQEDQREILCPVSGSTGRWYVLIGLGTNKDRGYIWAGSIPGDTGPGRIVFSPYPGALDGVAADAPDEAPADVQLAETAVPEHTAAPPEPTPTATPAVREYTVQFSGYEGVYDRRAHAAAAQTREPGVKYSYALCGENDKRPGDDWKDGLPMLTDAGELWAFLRAEKDGCAAVYEKADGSRFPAETEWVKVSLSIAPAPVTLTLRAEQEGQAVYSGEEQTLPMLFAADVAEDAGGLFSLYELTGADGWVARTEVTGTDAGTYPVRPTAEQLAFIQGFDANFDVHVTWQDSQAEIMPLPVTFESASAAKLYESDGGALRSDEPVQGTQSLAAGDYFSGDVMATGEQTEVGIGRNTIVLSGRFEERQSNYTFDLEAGAGVLAVFPQSISERDAPWDQAEAEAVAAGYADAADEPLPGYYGGMHVALAAESAPYDGTEKKIDVRFQNSRGEELDLEEGRDYSLLCLRDGEQTSDLTSPGVLTVRISGEGNYTGSVERRFIIEMAPAEVSVRLESWVYDGRAANSEAHMAVPDGPDAVPVYTYYDDAGEEIPAPSDAGSYRIVAAWPETDVSPAAEAECSFSIRPAEVTVRAGSETKVYGDEDPPLETQEVEGLLEGDSIPCTPVREEGEDAGTYAVIPVIAQEQENYLITCENGSFRIDPRPMDDEDVEVEWLEEEPVVRLKGKLLRPGTDYTAAPGDLDERSGREQMVLTGQGNFTGQRVVEREVAPELALSLTGPSGEEYADGSVQMGRDGVLALSGSVSSNVDLDTDRLEIRVNGRKVGAQWTKTDDDAYAFTLPEQSLSDEDELEVSVSLDGTVQDSQELSVHYKDGTAAWIALSAALAACSLVSLLVCIRMSKRLREERDRLLDTASRQSSRTIRQSDD